LGWASRIEEETFCCRPGVIWTPVPGKVRIHMHFLVLAIKVRIHMHFLVLAIKVRIHILYTSSCWPSR
jgi:hypothetical protein